MIVVEFLRKRPLSIILLAVPLAGIAEFSGWGEGWVLISAALGLVPLASLIGEATEALAAHTGPRIGGLLNATLGNAAELIISIIAIKEGFLDLVKASLTGSILGNLLLVMGMAMVFGGLRHGLQPFDRRQASNNAVLLTLSVLMLLVPSMISPFIGPSESPRVEAFSLGVAVIMLVIYGLGVLYGMRSSLGPIARPASHQEGEVWSVRTSLIGLALTTAGVSWMSELLVGKIDHAVAQWGISELFLGIILVPIVGNVAEHLVAVQVAGRNMMDLSVEIAVASSLQIALFVAPVLVFVSLIMGNPLQLIFHPFELLAVGAGVLVATMVSFDGESNWLEGVALLSVYALFGLAFFLL